MLNNNLVAKLDSFCVVHVVTTGVMFERSPLEVIKLHYRKYYNVFWALNELEIEFRIVVR